MFTFRASRACCLLALTTFLPFAAESAPVRQSPASVRAQFTGKPSTVPDDYVPTPMGLYVSSKCVITFTHPAGEGGTINLAPEGILQADGTRKPIPACNLPRYNRDGSPYVANGDVMDSATGNHDLLISAPSGASTNVFSKLAGPTIPVPLPAKVAGQTIYFTTAMSAGANAAINFLGFNMPGHANTWVAGVAVADYYGNVILNLSENTYRASKGMWYAANDKGTVASNTTTKAKFQQDILTHYKGYISNFINYYTADLLNNNTIFSIQTFGVTSCDMLPPLDSIPGQYAVSPFYGNPAVTVSPKVWSNGLCNMTGTADPGVFSSGSSFSNYLVKYDASTAPQGRSATITFNAE